MSCGEIGLVGDARTLRHGRLEDRGRPLRERGPTAAPWASQTVVW